MKSTYYIYTASFREYHNRHLSCGSVLADLAIYILFELYDRRSM